MDPARRPGRQSPKAAGLRPRRAAGKQRQHAAECGRENLLRLSTERDANTQLAQPLADRIGGETKGAGDREQESESAKEAEGDGSHLDWKETQGKLGVPGAQNPTGNGVVKIADHSANGG